MAGVKWRVPSLRRLTAWVAVLAATGALVAFLRVGRTGTAATPAAAVSAGSSKSKSIPTRAPRLAAEEAKSYAERKAGEATGLLALGRATGDPSWLQRALAEHPEDPRVQLERWNLASTPEEKLAAARALQAAAPDNPLGSYLEASQAFESRDLGAVARLMVDASFAKAYSRYEMEAIGETAEVFRASGMNEADALEAALGTSGLADVGMDLRRLGDNMGELQHVFVEMGYWDEADFMFERTLALGEQLQAGDLLVDSLAGIALQGKLLSSFDPETIVDLTGMTAAERLAQLEMESAELKSLATSASERIRALDDAGVGEYRAILSRDGELAALRWLNERK